MEGTGTSVLETPQTEEQIQQAANKVELDRMMKINLNGGILSEDPNIIPTEEAKPAAEPLSLTFEAIKEKFQYASPEDAIKDIEELRAFKATPPQPVVEKYENETSEKIAKALRAGKLKEVYIALDQQEKLGELTTIEVNKESAEKIIKMAIAIKNPTLLPEEVNFQYKNEYVVPKEPVQKSTEEDDDFKERHEEWKERVEFIETKRVIAAKMAQPELESAKQKIIFPEEQTQTDPKYLQYLKDLEQDPILDAKTKEAYGKLTPKDAETKIKFVDEANKIDFEFQHEPDVVDYKAAVEIASDLDKLISKFTKPDGTPDREGFAKAIYFGLNYEKALTQAMTQSKNATIKSFLPDNSGGTQRQFPQGQQLSELDQSMQQHGIRRAS